MRRFFAAPRGAELLLYSPPLPFLADRTETLVRVRSRPLVSRAGVSPNPSPRARNFRRTAFSPLLHSNRWELAKHVVCVSVTRDQVVLRESLEMARILRFAFWRPRYLTALPMNACHGRRISLRWLHLCGLARPLWLKLRDFRIA